MGHGIVRRILDINSNSVAESRTGLQQSSHSVNSNDTKSNGDARRRLEMNSNGKERRLVERKAKKSNGNAEKVIVQIGLAKEQQRMDWIYKGTVSQRLAVAVRGHD